MEDESQYLEQGDIASLLQTDANADVSKWELETQQLLEKLEHNLKGEIYDIKDDKWLNKGIRLMADEGVQTVISLMSPIIDKNSILSNTEEWSVFADTKMFADKITLLFGENMTKWNILPANFGPLVFMLSDVYLKLSLRAMGGGERDYRKTTTRVIQKTGFGTGSDKGDKHWWDNLPLVGR